MGTYDICGTYAFKIATGIILLLLLLGFGGNICGASDIDKISLHPPREGEFFGWSLTSGDYNGDGLSDVVVGNSFRDGEIYVYYGGDDFPTTPDKILMSPDANGHFGFYVTSGDTNKDGFDDLAVTMNWGLNKVYVYEGTSTGLEDTPDKTLTPPKSTDLSGFGHEISLDGDIDGDGCSDLVIGAVSSSPDPEFGMDSSYVCIYYGSRSGINNQFHYILDEYPGTGSIIHISTDGDLNADGFGDVVVSVAKIPPANDYEVYIYKGSSNGIVSTPQKITIPTPIREVYNGGKVASAGDLNGDGFADLLIGHAYADGTYEMEGKAYIFYGSSSDLSSSPDVIIDNFNPQYNARFGNAICGIEDFNFDGFDDIVIGCKGSTPTGFAYIYYGSPTGVTDRPSLILTEERYFGWAVSHVGDIKGNGQNFVLIGQEFGGAYLYALEDKTSPSIYISSPISGQIFNTKNITVSGTASDNVNISKVEIKVNNENWQTASGTLSWTVPVTLSEGSNTIVARSIDKTGNSERALVNVIIDTELPTIDINELEEDEKVTTPSITIFGTASDIYLDKVEVRVGTDAWQTASGTSLWNVSLILSEGQNTIVARAFDKAGNIKEKSLNVTLDIQAPGINIVNPKNDEMFKTSSISVSGLASNGDLDKVEVKVGNGMWQKAYGKSSWTVPVTLSEGSNTIVARSIDNAGNIEEKSLNVTLDTKAPTITIMHPKENRLFIISNTDVYGNASDEYLEKVEVKVGNGNWEPAFGTSSWNMPVVTLSHGQNMIFARATDEAGNIAEEVVIVNCFMFLEKIGAIDVLLSGIVVIALYLYRQVLKKIFYNIFKKNRP